ncbi:MAG TPA: hypothetical protein VGJ20_30970 [Xanthobacteraceae bacterium]|jgi:hypothetical protein
MAEKHHYHIYRFDKEQGVWLPLPDSEGKTLSFGSMNEADTYIERVTKTDGELLAAGADLPPYPSIYSRQVIGGSLPADNRWRLYKLNKEKESWVPVLASDGKQLSFESFRKAQEYVDQQKGKGSWRIQEKL